VLHDHDAVRSIEVIGIGIRKRVVEKRIERCAIDARVELRLGPHFGRPRNVSGLRG
jgi:hypothetical protein